MKKSDLKVGNKVYIHFSYGAKDYCIEETISRVGNKYVEAGGRKYFIDSGEEYNSVFSDGKLYLTEKEMNEDIERNKLIYFIFRHFNDIRNIRELSLDQLNIIKEIIEKHS